MYLFKKESTFKVLVLVQFVINSRQETADGFVTLDLPSAFDPVNCYINYDLAVCMECLALPTRFLTSCGLISKIGISMFLSCDMYHHQRRSSQ